MTPAVRRAIRFAVNGKEPILAGSIPLEGMRVLVLEDEYLIAMDVEEICRDQGAAQVTICGSLDELHDDASPPFDLAILDVMLGEASTLPFAKRLFEQRIPFVFATGYAESSDPFPDFAGVPVVTKPFMPADLLEALVAAVGRARSSGACV